jgi:hypothetical protein
MKKLIYKPGTLLLLAAVFLLTFSLTAQEVTKEFHKEYKADRTTTLDISNKYGDVVITAGDNDQVVIDVKVTVRHPDKSRAEKYLSMIDIKFSSETNLIKATTELADNFNFSGWGESRKFSIDYTVKMPYVTNLDLANRYGNTDIDELRGQVNLDIKYGDLSVDKLTRGNEKPYNKVTLSYGKGSIDEASWMEVNVRYCPSFTVGKSQALLLDSRYSKLKIGETSSIVGESKYDNYGIEKINNLVLQSGYTTINVGEAAKKLNFQGSYGSFNVNEIPAGFESLEVKVQYMSVKLGIAETACYTLEGHSSYGGIKFREENFKSGKHIVENNSTTLSGIMGKEASPKATVKLSASYGQIKLY